MKKWMTWVIALLAIAGVAVGAYYLIQSRAKTTATTSTAQTYTQTIAVTQGNITASLSPTGQLTAIKSASLSFNVPSSPVTEILVKAGQVVKQGDVLARVDTEDMQRTADQAEADLLTAQDALDTLVAGTTELDMLKLQQAVAQAQTTLAQAKQDQQDLLNPDLAKLQRAVRDAQYELDSARLNLSVAKINTAVGKTVRDLQYTVSWNERNVRDIAAKKPWATGAASASNSGQAGANSTQAITLAPGPGGSRAPSVEPMTLAEAQQALSDAQQQLALAQLNASATLTSAQNRVTQAETSLADAKTKLAEAQAGPDAVAKLQAENAITQADYKLAKAQDDLKTAQAGADPKKVTLAQARVDAAKATLAQAQASLDNAALKAPFDGSIVSIGVEVGDSVSTNQTAMTMADLTQFQVLAYIDETKISEVKVGQQARMTFDAFPGQTFQGKVLEVPIQGTLSNNVVTYEVPLSLENPEKLTLKPGLTANVTLVLGSKQNALLLPALAVKLTTDGYVVELQDAGGATTQTPVQVGLNNGTYVEIVRGLNAGDKVVATYAQSTSTAQQFNVSGRNGGILSIFGGGPR